eukprot:TRINITY_DN8072_c0_g1_i1.p1 TRINITY_DN8072_c0_g1~~TRINITY_DN8072_c0_g1_i1.p1  ORF type:complete len:797 (-),score=133.89 TRINITY_DN8072_c0_g1_i1:47-2437(-)
MVAERKKKVYKQYASKATEQAELDLARRCQLPEGWRIRSYRSTTRVAMRRTFFSPDGRRFTNHAKLKEAIGGKLPALFSSPGIVSILARKMEKENVKKKGNLRPLVIPVDASPPREPKSSPAQKTLTTAPPKSSFFDLNAERKLAAVCQLPEGWRVRSYRVGPARSLKRVFYDPSGRCYENYAKLREALGGDLPEILTNKGMLRAAFRQQTDVFAAQLRSAAALGLPEGWRTKSYVVRGARRRVYYTPQGRLCNTAWKLQVALGGIANVPSVLGGEAETVSREVAPEALRLLAKSAQLRNDVSSARARSAPASSAPASSAATAAAAAAFEAVKPRVPATATANTTSLAVESNLASERWISVPVSGSANARAASALSSSSATAAAPGTVERQVAGRATELRASNRSPKKRRLWGKQRALAYNSFRSSSLRSDEVTKVSGPTSGETIVIHSPTRDKKADPGSGLLSEAGWEKKLGLAPFTSQRCEWLPKGWKEAMKLVGDKYRKCFVSPDGRNIMWDKSGVFRVVAAAASDEPAPASVTSSVKRGRSKDITSKSKKALKTFSGQSASSAVKSAGHVRKTQARRSSRKRATSAVKPAPDVQQVQASKTSSEQSASSAVKLAPDVQKAQASKTSSEQSASSAVKPARDVQKAQASKTCAKQPASSTVKLFGQTKKAQLARRASRKSSGQSAPAAVETVELARKAQASTTCSVQPASSAVKPVELTNNAQAAKTSSDPFASTAAKPVELVQKAQGSSKWKKVREWQQIMHPEYKIPYWWNWRTRESVWQLPPGVDIPKQAI